MNQQVRVLFARENTDDEWYTWYAMSEGTWEAGSEFPRLPSGYESREAWIYIDHDAVQKALNTPPLDGKISLD